MKHRVEVNDGTAWHLVIADESKGFCEGYVFAMGVCPGPRLAYRAVREDGSVTLTTPARSKVSIGQTVGFPTAEQYESAGNAALERARQIRARKR
jgi:hypothetical protein